MADAQTFGFGAALRLIGTITAGATLLQAANGLLQALLPLRMQANGLSIAEIGIVATVYGFGFAAGCFLAPGFVARVGHIRAFASLAAVSAVVALSFSQAGSVWAWALLRGLSGLALAGLFTVIDGWVSSRSSSGTRGRILSVYMVCTKLALVLSPLGVGLGEVAGQGLFMGIAALMCLAILPVAGSVVEEPRPPNAVALDLGGLYRAAPSAMAGAFGVGLMNGPVLALSPIYGVGVGLPPDQAAALLLALQAGSLAFQWPLGWLSDHIDRRAVIAGLSAATAALSAGMMMIQPGSSPALIFVALLAWGGTALCIYAVCVAHACDLVEPGRIVPTISSLLVSWSTGVMIGPLPGAAFMARFGPQGLFLFAAGVSLALAGFVVARMLWQRRSPAGGGFVDIAPTSPASAKLGPRGGGEDGR